MGSFITGLKNGWKCGMEYVMDYGIFVYRR